MGREGGDYQEVAPSEDKIESLLEEFNQSKRQKEKTVSTVVCENIEEAKKKANIELESLGRKLGDNYHVVNICPFFDQNNEAIETLMEPNFQAVEDSFHVFAKTFELNLVDDEKMVKCNRCESTINNVVLTKKRSSYNSFSDMLGVCPVCQDTDTDTLDHIQPPKYDYSVSDYGGRRDAYQRQCEQNAILRADFESKQNRLNNMLDKIKKRPAVQNSIQKRMFNKLNVRPLLKQPAHADALNDFKSKVATLLTRQDQLQKQQPKDIIKYLVSSSWLSSHDEWQEVSDMDDY